jgi:hypothetical protein
MKSSSFFLDRGMREFSSAGSKSGWSTGHGFRGGGFSFAGIRKLKCLKLM